MKTGLARVGLTAAIVVNLLGLGAPEARADTAFTATITGAITLNAGLGWPIVTLPLPQPPALVCLPLNGTFAVVPNCHLDYPTGHQRAMAMGAVTCIGASANFLKDPKPPFSGPLCGFAATGFVKGHCGFLNGSQVTGTYTDGVNVFALSLHITGMGTVLGHYVKVSDPTNHGLVVGAGFGVATPVLLPTPTPTHTFNNDCRNKTATTFTLTMTLTGIPDLAL